MKMTISQIHKKTLEETFRLNKTKLVTGAIGKKILEKRNLGKESETINEMRNQSWIARNLSHGL